MNESRSTKNAITALNILSGALKTLALSFMWNWFVSPLGVREIGIAHAGGLFMLVQLLKSLPMMAPARFTDDENLERAVANAMLPLVVLAFGIIMKVAM